MKRAKKEGSKLLLPAEPLVSETERSRIEILAPG